jgi:D-alanyl-D-alanine carboxypeptidase
LKPGPAITGIVLAALAGAAVPAAAATGARVTVTGPAGSWNGSYLPDLLPASYPDITVRELLNHTSGLPEGTLGSGDAAVVRRAPLRQLDPAADVDEATTHPMRFAPGTQQQYNGTNYYVAGLLIEKVTGHSYADEVGRRILKPLGLHDTFVLDRRDPRLPGSHSHGYVAVIEAPAGRASAPA